MNMVGPGISATYFRIADVLVTADGAINQLLGSAADSPITRSSVQGLVALSTA
jgi:outer membrane scaffolding protein for murein synthesis (MipA/OmpV family)